MIKIHFKDRILDINEFIWHQGVSVPFLSSRKITPFFREIEKLDPETREALKDVKASDLNIRTDLIW